MEPRETRLDPDKPVIDGILTADLTAPRKQRHTVKRIFDRLLDEHGEGLNRPLDDYTAEAIGEYLAYRHRRWPNSTNPHLLVSRNTATTTTAVGTFWMDRLVKDLPVGVDRLRQDRILEEALASGADPLHLAHVFSLGAETSLRHTTPAAVSAVEHESLP
ncbi:hypothetical protein [Streptomyces sp. NPDC002644]